MRFSEANMPLCLRGVSHRSVPLPYWNAFKSSVLFKIYFVIYIFYYLYSKKLYCWIKKQWINEIRLLSLALLHSRAGARKWTIIFISCVNGKLSAVVCGAPRAPGKMGSWSHLHITMINLANSVPDPSHKCCLRRSSGHHSNVARRRSVWHISAPRPVRFKIGWEWFYGKLLLNHSVLHSFSQSSAGLCKMIHDVSLLP